MRSRSRQKLAPEKSQHALIEENDVILKALLRYSIGTLHRLRPGGFAFPFQSCNENIKMLANLEPRSISISVAFDGFVVREKAFDFTEFELLIRTIANHHGNDKTVSILFSLKRTLDLLSHARLRFD